MAKRIFSLFLCCLLLIPCLAVPAKADSLFDYLGIADFFDWVWSRPVLGFNFLISLFDDDNCGLTPNTDGRHNFVERFTQDDGKAGYYYICEYCGKSAGEVGREAYDDYTASLPSTGFNSDGHLIWYVFDSFRFCNVC